MRATSEGDGLYSNRALTRRSTAGVFQNRNLLNSFRSPDCKYSESSSSAEALSPSGSRIIASSTFCASKSVAARHFTHAKASGFDDASFAAKRRNTGRLLGRVVRGTLSLL